MNTGTGILLSSILLGGIYLTRKPVTEVPVTWDIVWVDDLPTQVYIHGIARGGPGRRLGLNRREDNE